MQLIFNRMIQFIIRHATITIVLVGLATIGFIIATIGIRFDADYSSLLPPAEESFIVPAESQNESEFSTDHVVLVESDDLFTPEVLTAISRAMANMSALDSVGPVFSAFDFVTVEKRGTRLVTIPMSPKNDDAPWTEEEAQLFRNRVMEDEIARNLLVSENGKSLVIVFSVKPNNTEALALYSDIWNPVRAVASVYVSGGATINERVMTYLTKDLARLLMLSFIVILLVYYLSFRAKRAMFIPLSLSLVGILWTFGTMSLLGYSLTIINIITPCLVLTIGSSYSIHVLTEYFQSFKDGHGNYVHVAVSRIGRTILLACITDVVGFLALLTAETDAFKEFGISVSIGISFCAILSITYLPAVLSVTIKPQNHQVHAYQTGLIAQISTRIARIIVRLWPWFLALFLIIGTGFFLTKDHIGLDANYMSYLPKKDVLLLDSKHITTVLKGTNSQYITLDAPGNEPGYFYKPEIIQAVHEFERQILAESNDVSHIVSFPSYVSFMNSVSSGSSEIPETPGIILLLTRYLKLITTALDNPSINMLMNEDGSRITITLKTYDSEENNFQSIASVGRVMDVVETHRSSLPDGIKMTAWGEGTDGLRFSTMIMSDQSRATLVSFLVVFAISVISFRSFKLGMFSIIPILVGIMANYIFMFFAGIPFDMVTVGFTSVTIGVGIDNALHFLIRYNNKRCHNKLINVRVLLQQTIKETGRPILLSTLSIVFGLGMLMFASYTPVRYFGLLVSISLVNSMLATLFILPSVIILVEEIPRKRRKKLKMHCPS